MATARIVIEVEEKLEAGARFVVALDGSGAVQKGILLEGDREAMQAALRRPDLLRAAVQQMQKAGSA